MKDGRELSKLFQEQEESLRERYNQILREFPDRKPVVGKHEALVVTHLKSVLKSADEDCPKAADTIRWLLWHDILTAQWYLHMAEMLPGAREDEQ